MTKFLYVMGKVLSCKLSCTLTGSIKVAATFMLISAHINGLLGMKRCNIHWLQYETKVLIVIEG